MHGTSFLVFALYIFTVTGLLLYPQLPWRIPFFLVFALYIFIFTGRLSILNCHGASFSVVLALYIVLFFMSTGLLLYSQLSWHILFLSLHPLYCLFSLASLLSTVMAHPFTSDFSPCIFYFVSLSLAFYSTRNCHGIISCVSSIIYVFRPPQSSYS